MLALFLLSLPLFYLIESQNLTHMVFAILIFSLIIAITCAPLNTYMLSLFPRQYRYSGFGVAFHVGITIFGGTAPLFMTWLIERTHQVIAPAWYFMSAAIIGLFSLFICEKSKVNSREFLIPKSLEGNNASFLTLN